MEDPPAEPPVHVDFFLIGVHKCASTWLCRCLDEHPEIVIGEPYQKGFFVERSGMVYSKPNPGFMDDWDRYRELFPPVADDQLRGDGSVPLFHNPSAPELLHDLYPDAKLLVMLRDPVDRTYSTFQHLKRHHPDDIPDSFPAFLDRTLVVDRSRYSRHLRRWFRVFDRDRFRIRLDLDLTSDPAGLMRDMYRFLDVDAGFEPPSLHRRVNPPERKRAPLVAMEKAARALRSIGLDPVMDALDEAGIGPAIRDAGT